MAPNDSENGQHPTAAAAGPAAPAADAPAADAPAADAPPGDAPAVLAGLVPLARELNALKRVHAAGRPGSWASRGFARAWGRLAAGQPADDVARMELVAAVTATRLGAVDAEFFAAERLPQTRVYRAMRRGWMAATSALGPDARLVLRATAGEGAGPLTAHIVQSFAAAHEMQLPAPGFVARLAEQPRAGPTRPDAPRLMLVPRESHAEHSWTVAITAALLAAAYGADAGVVFVAGLAHHLANAWLPDGGEGADAALDGEFAELVPMLRARAVAELPPTVRAMVEHALAVPSATGTPDARAFHAADALDEVLELEWFARVAAFTVDDARAGRPRATAARVPDTDRAEADRAGVQAALWAAGLLPAGG
jgi:5'-deoxynucleotidase YfbR-like HD superfamily hydrolase